MKKILVLLILFSFVGMGCSTVRKYSSRSIEGSHQQAEGESGENLEYGSASVPVTPVPLSQESAPSELIARSKKAGGKVIFSASYDTPFRVVAGQTFKAEEGCAESPSYIEHYSLQEIVLEKGVWNLVWEQYGPLMVKLNTPAGEEAAAWEKEFLQATPQTLELRISQADSIDYVEGTGGVYASNGVFIPVFVSAQEIYLQYIQLSY